MYKEAEEMKDDLEFEIKFDSVYDLERELRTYSRKYNEYLRLAKEATTRVNDLTLELKILSAKIIEKIRKEEKIPPSALGEIRKSRIFLDKDFQKKMKELNRATEDKDYIDGLVKSWEARGYRLQELVTLAKYGLDLDKKQGVNDLLNEVGEKLAY